MFTVRTFAIIDISTNINFSISTYIFSLLLSINMKLISCGCGVTFDNECPDYVNPGIFYSGNKIPKGIPFRAMQTIPEGFFIQTSRIPNSGLGAFSGTFVKKHTWLGEYEGDFLPMNMSSPNVVSSYSWIIQYQGRFAYYVDAKSERMSNWLRYINCARNITELNVYQSQCYGRIYYRTTKDIYPGQELLAYYGPAYANYLGIDIQSFHKWIV